MLICNCAMDDLLISYRVGFEDGKKQQLEVETQNKELIKQIRMKFIAIGAPLNDNILKMNKKQLQWCASILDLVDQLQ